MIGGERARNQAEWQAWSQNLGHESPVTTARSYAQLPQHQQAQLVQEMRERRDEAEVLAKMRQLLGS